MIDISEHVRVEVCKRIWPYINNVRPFVGNYRRLEDLRIHLKRLFPQEPQFDEVDGTASILTKLFSNKKLFVIQNYENRRTKEITPVYTLPQEYIDFPKPTRYHEREVKSPIGDNVKTDISDIVKSTPASDTRIQKPMTEGSSGKNEEIRRNPQAPLNKFAHIPNLDLFFETIAKLAKPEDWAYRKQSGRFRYSILESYLDIVIERLQYERDVLRNENKIIEATYTEMDENGKHRSVKKCVINTGLVSRGRGNFIYIIFHKNHKPDLQEWVLRNVLDVTDRKDSQSFLPFNGKFPAKPDFEATLGRSSLVFPDAISAFNEEHILEKHCERLPIQFLKQYFGSYFSSRKKTPATTEEWDDFRKYLKTVSRDDTKVNYGNAATALKYNIQKALTAAQGVNAARAKIYRPSKQSVGFFLPLYLEDREDDTDFDVGVIIDEDENHKGKYVARTIYRTSMAYARIRVMGDHICSWLDPKRIQYWINPCPANQDEKANKKLTQKR